MNDELMPADIAFIDAFIEGDLRRKLGEHIVGMVDASSPEQREQDSRHLLSRLNDAYASRGEQDGE